MSSSARTVITLPKSTLLSIVVLCLSVLMARSVAQNFVPAVDYPTQMQPSGIAVADFNGDGNADVVVANSGSHSLSLLLGNGDGTFEPPITLSLSPVRPVSINDIPQPVTVATGDFNGDGKQDIAVGFTNTTVSVQILFGNGDGTFSAGVNQQQVSNLVDNFQLTVGDFNEDGRLDIAAATDAGLLVLLNDGSGTLRTTSTQPFSGSFTTHFATGYINGDKHLDIVAILGDGSVQETLGNGDGTFQTPITIPFPASTSVAAVGSIALGDFNQDGRPDLVFVEFGNTSTGAPPAIHINLQRLDGTFTGAQLTLTPTVHPTSVLVGDFNGDGQTDIAVLSGLLPSDPNAVVIYLGQGILNFAPPTSFNVSFLPNALLSASLTNSPALDLITADLNANAISVLVNHGANTLSLSSSTNPSALSQPVTLTATVQPKFSASGSLSGAVMFTDGPAILGTSSVSSSGSGSITARFNATGNHSVRAAFTGNSNFVASSASLVQVVNKAAASVSLSSSSNPTLFGQSLTFNVAVTGAQGGPVPTGTINLLDGPSIILSGTLDSSGKASLNTSSLAVGIHQLTAQYAGDPNNATATSPPLAQTVNKNSSATSLTANPSSAAFGESIAFTAIVSAPAGAVGTPTGNVTFSDGSTVVGTTSLDANGKGNVTLNSLSVGTHSITASYTGDSNFSGSTSATVSEVISKASTSTTLATAPNPSTVGQSVTLSATVAVPGNGAIPAGSVTFSDGPAALGTVALDNTGKATLSVSSLSFGTHSIVASYTGNADFVASSSNQASQVVNKAPTTTALATTPNPSTFGQTITLIATIAPSTGASGVPSGTVAFSDGTVALGTSAVDNSGKATLVVSSLSVGGHSLLASYSGDGTFSASVSSPVSETVSKSASSIVLVSSPNPSVFGQPVTLTVTVTGASPGAGTPSGTVTFVDGSSTIGTTSLDQNGKATFTVGTLSVGSHTLGAAYAGNSNFNPSAVSGPSDVTQVVNQSNTATALSSSPNPSVFGQPITLTSTVTPAGGGGIPSGTVTFQDGSMVLGAIPLDSNGSAVLSLSTLAVGSHSITASYSGSAGYLASRSATTAQVVSKNSVSIGFSSTPNPSTVGQPVVFSVKVVPNSPGGAQGTSLPTGTITFNDGSSVLGSVALDSSGMATFTTTILSAGSHTITATFGGDANFSEGSSSQTQVIRKITTTTSLTSSMNPATNTTTITLTATVLAGGTPTGAVAFLDGAKQVGASPVDSSGHANLMVAKLAVGTHSIVAAYSGDSTFAASQSSPLLENINQPAGDFTLSVSPGALQVVAGRAISAQLSLAPLNGLTGLVTISCLGLPINSHCTITPNNPRLDGANASIVLVTIFTTGASIASVHPGVRDVGAGLMWAALLPFTFGFVLIPADKKKMKVAGALVVLCFLLSGCGGGSFNNKPPVPGTPPGNYTITIQAKSGSLTHSAPIHLTVR